MLKMHDPMVVAFDIRRPWPKVSRIRDGRPRGIRGAFWRIGNVELYWPTLLTVWHVEPGDEDAFSVCKMNTHWKWHVAHWRLQFTPWQHFRRWAFTRCAWCGGKSRKGDRVNTGRGWEPESKPKHWWQGEVGTYHGDCLSIDEAHRECLCEQGVGSWDHGFGSVSWGPCSNCGGWRHLAHVYERPEAGVRAATRDILRSIPKGGRDPLKTAAVAEMWKNYRDTLAA